MVSRPAVPPYSSTMMATWTRRDCISLQQVVHLLRLGDEVGLAHDLPHVDVQAPLAEEAQAVLDVEDAGDVVDRLSR